MKVIKRDGTTVDFDRSKIIRAIQKANEAVGPEERISEEQISAIAHFVQERNRPRLLVEDIQDMVERQLMELGKYTLAKAYIIYRYTRALVRKQNTTGGFPVPLPCCATPTRSWPRRTPTRTPSSPPPSGTTSPAR